MKIEQYISDNLSEILLKANRDIVIPYRVKGSRDAHRWSRRM